MLSQMKDMMGLFQVVQRLMGDENFRTFIAHPKVQEVFTKGIQSILIAEKTPAEVAEEVQKEKEKAKTQQ